MDFPLKYRMSKKMINEFHACEFGSYEDYLSGRMEPVGDAHVCEIIDRWKTQIEIKNKDELKEVWYSLCSGTFDMHFPRSARALADKMLSDVKQHPDWDNFLWKYPSFS